MSTRLVPTEQDEHRTLAQWLDLHGLLWLHVPLGGYRRPVEAAILHGLGARAGAPDFFVFTRPPLIPESPGVVIELKRLGRDRERDGGLSPEQRRWLEALEAYGWQTKVAYGAGEAIWWLESLGYGHRR